MNNNYQPPTTNHQPLSTYQYALPEQIGDPYLFVGREYEFKNFNKWIANIPKRISRSRVILARRKSGKTAFVQRIFNNLWNENGMVIPFYFTVDEQNMWYKDFAVKYFCTFATQYISFMERDETLAGKVLKPEQIKAYAELNNHDLLADDAETMIKYYKEEGWMDLLWETAYKAPSSYANLLNIRFLVIIDEFQNLTQYVYPDKRFETKPIETMPGSFHYVVESKLAPMLVTGSYMGWVLKIISKYLQAGRLAIWRMNPYLTPEEGLEAIYRYAEVYDEPITNETAILINQLCLSDPFFISCVMQSNNPDRDLTTVQGIISTVNYEVTNRDSFLAKTWAEYIQQTVDEINNRYAKDILLHLNQQADRYWTPQQLKDHLNLSLDVKEIKRKLILLSEADLIMRGSSDIDFRGLQDGTLNLILRNRFEKEVTGFVPDLDEEFNEEVRVLKSDINRLRGKISELSGRLAERIVATEFRTRKRFKLSALFEGVRAEDDTDLNIIEVKERVIIQRSDSKPLEIDSVATSSDGRVVLVEVKNTQAKTNLKTVEDFYEKGQVYQQQFPEQRIILAFLSLGGFVDDAKNYCQQHNICTAEDVEWYVAGFK